MSDAPDDASRWSWVTPSGAIIAGAKGELMLALRSERLPPSTLVWRPTWAEWLPASRIKDLAGVLRPEVVEPARAPRRLATQLTPPVPGAPLPPEAMPAVSAPPPAPVRAKGMSSHPPPAPTRSKGVLQPTAPRVEPNLPRTNVAAQARPGGILGPPREELVNTASAMRAPLPTLAGEEDVKLRSTLRPPGAVPPPPRSGLVGATSLRADDEPATAHKAAAPSAVPDTEHDAPAPTELRPGIVMPSSAEALAANTEPAPLPSPAPPSVVTAADFEVTLGSTPFEPAPPVAGTQAAEPVAASSTLESAAAPPVEEAGEKALEQWLSLDWTRDKIITFAFFGGVVVLAAVVFLVFIVARTKTPSAAAGAVPEAANAPSSTSAGPKGCRLLEPAARLATAVERSVQPTFAEIVRGERVAVGFVPAPKGAAGLIVRLDTLDAERPFEQSYEAGTRGVVPLVRDGKPTFYIDHADSELAGARTVAEGVTLGFDGQALVLARGGKKNVLWPEAAIDKTTDPRVATTANGSLITFRRGGIGGQVLYGWVGKDGGAAGLVPLDAPGIRFSGTPDAAGAGETGLVAFAGRQSDKDDWRIQLALVPQREKATVRVFEPPAGGPGGGNIAPSIAAFGNDGWILQWTEGATGKYEVRMARLGPDLMLLGEARLVSPKGANAGQGSVFASGSRVLSVFVQTTAGHDELWGASFECL